MGAALDRLLHKLDGVKPSGDTWVARCPSHDDHLQSLQITPHADGHIGLYCHKGCATLDVLAVLNGTYADLFEQNGNGNGAGHGTPDVTYDYVDEHGHLLYEVCRYHTPKTFRQRRPDGHGDWIWKLDDKEHQIFTRRVLFGLPTLQGQSLVYIVEGEKDALALRALGLTATTNSGGAGKWRSDLTAQLKAAGVEQVIIIADNDAPGKQHAKRVARSTKAAGFAVRILELPGLPPKGDVSWWLANGGTKANLEALIASMPMDPLAPAGPPDDEPAANASRILDPSDPMASARAFVAHAHQLDDLRTLHHYADHFAVYDPAIGAYQDLADSAIRAALYRFLDSARQRRTATTCAPFKPTRSKVENVLDALRAICYLPDASAPPCWLQHDPGLDPFDILPSRNGLLYIPTRQGFPATPAFFTHLGLDFAYDLAAPEPTHWLHFLADLWPDDPASPETLQEWFGYLLTPRTQFQKIFMVVGPKRSGKSTIGRVLWHLLGARHVCSPTLAHLGEPFGLSHLIGKSAAIIADARIGSRTDAAVVAERLLSISGEDAPSIPRKFLPDWNGRLSTRFLLLTNELPRIEDASGALASRFIVLALRRSFYGHEDHGLFDRFVPELPGILNWALDGYDRLYARGRFVQPASAADLIQQFEDLGSPIAAFLRARCAVQSNYDVMQAQLFEAWKAWCHEIGRDRSGTIQIFGRNLRAALPWLTESRPWVAGKRVRYYEGLRLKTAAEQDQGDEG